MADISKIVPDGTEYNLKDSTARENIGNVKASVADDFSASVNYAVGDFCYHLGTLYKCTTAHSAGAWNSAHFTATQVGDEISELKNTLIAYPDYAAQTWILNANTTYPYTYTAPKDGFIIVNRLITNVSGTKLAINGLSIISLSNDMETTGGMYPVRKNDTVVFNGLTTTSRAYFVPFRV